MGVFFVGAYQETLGDLHNLFGDTNVVTIDLRGDGGFDLLHEQEGDSIAEVCPMSNTTRRLPSPPSASGWTARISAGRISCGPGNAGADLAYKDSLAATPITNDTLKGRGTMARRWSWAPAASVPRRCTRWR